MRTFRESLNERLEKESFRKEYDAIRPGMDIIRASAEADRARHLTQAELAERTGIDQGDISRLECGNRNPSLQMLKKLAEGLGMTLRIEFVPKDVHSAES